MYVASYDRQAAWMIEQSVVWYLLDLQSQPRGELGSMDCLQEPEYDEHYVWIDIISARRFSQCVDRCCPTCYWLYEKGTNIFQCETNKTFRFASSIYATLGTA